MNRAEPALQLVDLLRTDFRTSAAAEALGVELQAILCLPYRYHPARLAIGLSLRDPAPPPPASDLLGKVIKGEALFGHEEHDLAMWLGLLVEHSGKSGVSRRFIQDEVAAHWERGMHRLWQQWTNDAKSDLHTFYSLLTQSVAE